MKLLLLKHLRQHHTKSSSFLQSIIQKSGVHMIEIK